MSMNNHEQAVYALMTPARMMVPNNPELDGTPWPPSEHNVESAKVWATMALAYEQRTANLIALFGEGFAGRGLPYGDIFSQIKERLGIE